MIPEKLQHILDDLKSQEWVQKLVQNAEIYIVGGTVRDAFINRPMKDIDMVVDGLSVTGIQKILKSYGKQKLVGESFAVIKFIPHGHVGEDYDIAVPRIDKKIGKGHKGFEIITEGVDIMEDLKRRDFTINSMAINVMTGELLDPFNGKEDALNGKIKATDAHAFIEDPLRILRGIQFAARFNFDIEKSTLNLMKNNSNLVKEISGERILDEFQKIILKEGNTQLAMNLLHETGIDEALFDKKMLKYDKGFERLDAVSFYYMLGLVGDVDPHEFYMKRLKGEAPTGKAIKTLDNLIGVWYSLTDKEDKLYVLFKALQKAPVLADTALLAPDMIKIIDTMKAGKIPSTASDIQLTGDDVMAISGLKGKEVGLIIEKYQRDALINKYNWKDRSDSIDYLQDILK